MERSEEQGVTVDTDGETQIVTIGSTQLLPTEVDSPTPDSWGRALAHAEARARTLAASLDRNLGAIHIVEQIGIVEGDVPELAVRVTFMLEATEKDPRIGETRSAIHETGVLQSISDDLRPVYQRFRQRVLALSPRVNARPAPERNGKHMYEGFRVDRSRNTIYAGFRRSEVILRFELPKNHQMPQGEFKTSGGRDWLLVRLTSLHQVDGAVELARETIGRTIPEIAR